MALSNSTGLVSEAGGETDEVVAWFWLSLLVRGRESLLGGSGSPVEDEDRESIEAALSSLVWAGPASVWKTEALPEVAATVGAIKLFPCCPGDTFIEEQLQKNNELYDEEWNKLGHIQTAWLSESVNCCAVQTAWQAAF